MGGEALAALMGLFAALAGLGGGGGGGSSTSNAAPEANPATGGNTTNAPAALAITAPDEDAAPEEEAPEDTPAPPTPVAEETPPAEPAMAPAMLDEITPEPEVSEDPAPAAAAAAPDPVVADVQSGAPDLPDSAYDIGWNGLTDEEQYIVELVNRARLDPVSELGRQNPNEGFAAGVTTAPKEALAVVETLSDAADHMSEDMDARNFFDHTDPDGDTPADRAQQFGHENRFVGENIGWAGSTGAYGDLQTRAQGHHDRLWDSDGHQQNFMSDNWSEIGVGYDYGDYTTGGVNYTSSTFVTEKFGDTGKTYLTGVVIDDEDGNSFYDLGEGQGGVRITAWNDDGVFATATWDSGGYTLELPPGTYNVAFEGGDLDGVYETTVTIGSENVKLDVIEDRDAVGDVLSSGAEAPVAAVMVSPAVPDPTQAAVDHLLSGADDAAALAAAEAYDDDEDYAAEALIDA